MFKSLKEILGYGLQANDGTMGKVDDFFFDDQMWTIRYLVADTSRWLGGRKVLISTNVLGEPEWDERTISVDLTKEDVYNSPDVDTRKPVSRKHEIALHRYYGWPQYWTSMGPLGEYVPSMQTGIVTTEGHLLRSEIEKHSREMAEQSDQNVHLRSIRKVMKYGVIGTDGEFGPVVDFIADQSDWTIRYAVVDTKDRIHKNQVLIPPQWAESISWDDSAILFPISCETIANCPHYDASAPINRSYEEVFYDFYGRPRYWLSDLERETALTKGV